jgi:hypothetical protein
MKPRKLTHVRPVDRLPPLEILPEVQGAQVIPNNFHVVAQRAALPETDTDHFQAIHN